MKKNQFQIIKEPFKNDRVLESDDWVHLGFFRIQTNALNLSITEKSIDNQTGEKERERDE